MSLRFLLDENIAPSVADSLRESGYDVVHVRNVGLRGAQDPDVMSFARAEQRVLVTQDAEFADIRRYPLGTHSGIIRIRLALGTSEAVSRVLSALIPRLEAQDIQSGALVITDGRRFRVRRRR